MENGHQYTGLILQHNAGLQQMLVSYRAIKYVLLTIPPGTCIKPGWTTANID